MKALILPATLLILSGIFSGIADISSTPAKFNQSLLLSLNPEWEYGEYIGHKDQTWVNKYKEGTLDVKFPGSKTFLVWTTDLWHGARMLMNLFLFVGALLWPKPSKWWMYGVYYLLMILAYSSGWHLINLALL